MIEGCGRRRFVLAITALIVLLALAGCGGDGERATGGANIQALWQQPGGDGAARRSRPVGVTAGQSGSPSFGTPIPAAVRSVRVRFTAPGLRCCVGFDPRHPAFGDARLLVLESLPVGPASVEIAGFATDFVPDEATRTTCNVRPADVAFPCDTRFAEPSFASAAYPVTVVAGARNDVEVPVSSQPFLIDESILPAPASSTVAPTTVAFVVADAVAGIDADTVAVDVTRAPGANFTLAACDDAGSQPCSTDGSLNVRGFRVASAEPLALAAGPVGVRVRATNLAPTPSALDTTYGFVVSGVTPPTPSPTAADTASPSPEPSATPTPVFTPSATATANPTATPTPNPSSTATPEATSSATATESPTATETPTSSPSSSPTDTVTPTASASPSETSSPTATETPTSAPSETPTTAATATPTSTPSEILPSETPTSTATETPNPSPSETPTFTPSETNLPETPTASPSATATASPIPTDTALPSATPSASPTDSPTAEPTPSETSVATVTPTDSPTPTTTASATPSETETALPTATETELPSPTASATPTALPSSTPTASETPTASPIPTDTATATATPSPSRSATASATPSASPSPTSSPTYTATATPTATNTPSATASPSATPSASPSNSPTATPTASPSASATASPSRTPSTTPTSTPTSTPSTTPTHTPSSTPSPTSTPSTTATRSATSTPTRTPTTTLTPTSTPTASPTPSVTRTPTRTPTASPTRSATSTPTHTATPTATRTATFTPTATATFAPPPSPAAPGCVTLGVDGAASLPQNLAFGCAANFACARHDDGDTSYVYSESTAGFGPRVDVYSMEDLVDFGAVGSVTVHAISRSLEGAAGSTVRPIVRSGVNKAGFETQATSTAYTQYSATFGTTPSGGAWSAAAVNGLLAGVEHTAAFGDQTRTTVVWLEVCPAPATATPTNTVPPTASATPSPTVNASATPSDTPTSAATSTPTSTPSNTPTSTSTSTPTPTASNTPTITSTNTPTNTATSTPTSTATSTPTSTASNTPTITPTPSATPTPTEVDPLLGDGSDGPLNLNDGPATTIVNTYTHLLANAAVDTSTLQVQSTLGFAVGDEVLIVQCQSLNAVSLNHEFAVIQAIPGGNTLELASPLGLDFYSGTFNAPASSAAQVVRVPHFTDVSVPHGTSIVAPAWNGNSGGIVVFRASGTVSIAGSIDAQAKGYRGGAAKPINETTSNARYATSGESWTGIGNDSSNGENNSGGGGGGIPAFGTFVADGGGGGHETPGGNGINPYSPTSSIPGLGGSSGWRLSALQLLFGPGGGGGMSYASSYGNPSAGRAGGGVVHLFVRHLQVTGTISANGAGGNPGSNVIGINGGAGAGGTIQIYGHSLDIGSNLVTAQGGASFSDSGFGNGAGGAGLIFFIADSITGSSNPPAGVPVESLE